MPYPLNNVTTLDGYDDARTTLLPPKPAPQVQVLVANAGVYMQLERCDGLRVGGGLLLPEEFKAPGMHGIDRGFPIGRVRFRSAAPGTPAQVSGSAAF